MTGLNIAAALVAFQANMPTVHKGKTARVPTKAGGEYKYDYADLADVSGVVTPLLAQQGLAFTCKPRRTAQNDYELVGALVHDSGESIKGSLPLYGRTPQEIGSSITYGRRYLLGCLTGIVTDDDDDNQTRPVEPVRRATTRQDDLAAAQARVKVMWLRTHNTFDLPEVATAYAAYVSDADVNMAPDLSNASPADLDWFANFLQSAVSAGAR